MATTNNNEIKISIPSDEAEKINTFLHDAMQGSDESEATLDALWSLYKRINHELSTADRCRS